MLSFLLARHMVQWGVELLNATHGRYGGPYDQSIDVQVVRLPKAIRNGNRPPNQFPTPNSQRVGVWEF